MGTIAEALEATSQSIIVENGMRWKVQKIKSADLARVGHAALAVAQAMNNPNAEQTGENTKDPEQLAQKLATSNVKNLESLARLKDAVLCAGLVAVAPETVDDWEVLDVVLEREKADPRKGRIFVGSVPTPIADKLFEEIMSLSTDGGRSLERLRAFRNGAGGAVSNSSSGENIQHAPGTGARP